jgi:hypothetical protein
LRRQFGEYLVYVVIHAVIFVRGRLETPTDGAARLRRNCHKTVASVLFLSSKNTGEI